MITFYFVLKNNSWWHFYNCVKLKRRMIPFCYVSWYTFLKYCMKQPPQHWCKKQTFTSPTAYGHYHIFLPSIEHLPVLKYCVLDSIGWFVIQVSLYKAKPFEPLLQSHYHKNQCRSNACPHHNNYTAWYRDDIIVIRLMIRIIYIHNW